MGDGRFEIQMGWQLEREDLNWSVIIEREMDGLHGLKCGGGVAGKEKCGAAHKAKVLAAKVNNKNKLEKRNKNQNK